MSRFAKKKAGPMDGASRQALYREKQKRLGRKGRIYYLTNKEKDAVNIFLNELRNYHNYLNEGEGNE